MERLAFGDDRDDDSRVDADGCLRRRRTNKMLPAAKNRGEHLFRGTVGLDPYRDRLLIWPQLVSTVGTGPQSTTLSLVWTE